MIRIVLAALATSVGAFNKETAQLGSHHAVTIKADGRVFSSQKEHSKVTHSLSDTLAQLRVDESFPQVVPFHWPSVFSRMFASGEHTVEGTKVHDEPPPKKEIPVAEETPHSEAVHPAKLPEQGFSGEGVHHRDMESITADWGKEYGPKEKKHAEFTDDFLKSGATGTCLGTAVALVAFSLL